MSGIHNLTYYSFRADEELQRGDEARAATVAAVHYELACVYAILAAQAAMGEPRLKLVPDTEEQLYA